MPAETDAPDDHRSPLSLRLADIAALALGAVALWIALLGGRRYLVFGLVVSLRSALPFVYAAVSILVVRHLLRPRPSALDHIASVRHWIRRHPISPRPVARSSRPGRWCSLLDSSRW